MSFIRSVIRKHFLQSNFEVQKLTLMKSDLSIDCASGIEFKNSD